MLKSKLMIAAAVLALGAPVWASTPASAAGLTAQHTASPNSFGDCMCELFWGMCPGGW